jgi:hypothetical protein
MKSSLAVLALLLCVGPAASQDTVRLLPVDEADQDSTFFDFRARLIEAVVHRDADYLLNQFSSDGLDGFGGQISRDEFARVWKPHRIDSEIWPVLGHVLAHGGAFEEDPTTRYFLAPYYSASWPGVELNSFEYAAIVGDRVPVRGEPKEESEQVASLSYDVVKLPGIPPEIECSRRDWREEKWQEIVLPEGGRGFVACRHIGMAIGYRIAFEKEGGEWVISFIDAGD